jgi:hypothetical protein
MDYNSSSFRNGAIDRLKGKFGKNDPDKPKVEGPVNLMGVQNVLNKGVAGIKKGVEGIKNTGKAIADTKINNPVKVEKSSEFITTSPIGKETTTTRKGLTGDRTITKKVVKDYETGSTTYSRSATNPRGGKMVETSKTVSSAGDVTKGRTRYDQKGDVMTSKSRSKTGKFFQ